MRSASLPTLRLPVSGAVLRAFRPDDAPALARHANDRAVWRNLRDRFPHPYALADAEWFINFVRGEESRNEVHFCLEVDGEAAGTVGVLFKHDVSRRSAEIGYWLGQAYWGRGIASAAVQAATEYVFGRFDLARLFAVVFEHNAASARVLEKAGFALEARLRQAVTKENVTMDGLLYAAVRPQ